MRSRRILAAHASASQPLQLPVGLHLTLLCEVQRCQTSSLLSYRAQRPHQERLLHAVAGCLARRASICCEKRPRKDNRKLELETSTAGTCAATQNAANSECLAHTSTMFCSRYLRMHVASTSRLRPRTPKGVCLLIMKENARASPCFDCCRGTLAGQLFAPCPLCYRPQVASLSSLRRVGGSRVSCRALSLSSLSPQVRADSPSALGGPRCSGAQRRAEHSEATGGG